MASDSALLAESPPAPTKGVPEGWDVRRPRPDPRLPAYLVAGFGAFLLAIATGRPEVVALGAPFLTLAAIGLIGGEPKWVTGRVTLDQRRAMEGDQLRGEVTVDWEGDAEVEILLAGIRGVTPIDPSPVVGWSLPAGAGPVTFPFVLEARSWGVHDLGALWVRARRKGALLSREHRVAAVPSVRVLPTALRVGRLLQPSEPRAIAGMHVARFRGQGSDFAELRPYRPGDRLRDLSWGTSARLGVPWVRVNHPERTGTVLLLLDAVFSDEEGKGEALARAARATWAVASMHLRAQDRVGLLASGRTVAWLPPRGGRRARWMLLDELLAIGSAAEDTSRRRRARSRITIPADAVVVGVTGLRSERFVPELIRHRRTGHATAALIIDTTDLLPTPRGPYEATARRLWLGQRAAERHLLQRGGVATALVTGDRAVGAAILSLRRQMNAARQPGRGGGFLR